MKVLGSHGIVYIIYIYRYTYIYPKNPSPRPMETQTTLLIHDNPGAEEKQVAT